MWGFNTKELDYLKKHVDANKTVLEYGPGDTSKMLINICKSLHSIEHNQHYYNTIKNTFLPYKNFYCYYKSPNKKYTEGGHDGTFDEFEDYVTLPIDLNIKFDVIIIDGRARVECAKTCEKTLNKDGVIFIHDIERKDYNECFDILNYIETVDHLGKFTLKI